MKMIARVAQPPRDELECFETMSRRSTVETAPGRCKVRTVLVAHE